MPDLFARAASDIFSSVMGADEVYTPPGESGRPVRVVFERDTQTMVDGLQVALAEPMVRVYFHRSEVKHPAVGARLTDSAVSHDWVVDGIDFVDAHVVIASVREAA